MSDSKNVFDAAPEVAHDDKEFIHKRHFQDGFPLCWTINQTGNYKATSKESEVTCPDCKRHMKD